MADFSEGDLRALDAKFATEGVAFHARPIRAAVELLGPRFMLTGERNPEVDAVVEAYERIFPDSSATWPGMGIGIAASGDRIRRIVVPVVYGSARIDLASVMGFPTQGEFAAWVGNDRNQAGRAYFAAADVLDVSYGTDDIRGRSADVDKLWRVARSNLEDVANILVNGFTLASVIQPISLVVELSLKAGLISAGVLPAALRVKPFGHNLVNLASKLGELKPHRDDALIAKLVGRLPDYVGSRYEDIGLTRLQVVDLALGAQFIAASVARRFSSRDMAINLERDTWPGSREVYFP